MGSSETVELILQNKLSTTLLLPVIATDRGAPKGLQCQHDTRNQGLLCYYLSTSPTLECLSDAHHQGLQYMSDDTILKQLPHYVVLN